MSGKNKCLLREKCALELLGIEETKPLDDNDKASISAISKQIRVNFGIIISEI